MHHDILDVIKNVQELYENNSSLAVLKDFERVFEEMDDQVPEENQESRTLPAQFQALRHHFHDRCGQHEPRAQGHEVSKVGSLPVLLNNDGSAEDVGGCGR